MDTVAYHRRFVYDINYLQGIVPGHPDGSECLVCAETDGLLPKIISMDRNFRLVRKKSAGTSVQKPHHEGRFFIKIEDVEPFLRNQTCAHDTDCSDFKAGTPSRAMFKAAKLDVTGLFGCICIHDYPQLFINMNSGKKLGYAVFIISKLKEKTDVKVLYDIACRLQPQLDAAKVKLSTSDLATPLFHGFAHNSKCQMDFNPKNKEEFCLADGENTERLWSELTKFTYITKEMTPANRQDLLVDALIYRGERTMHSVVTTWQMDYAILLKKWYALRWRVAGVAIEANELEAQTELQRLEDKLQKTETGKKIQRWTQDSPTFKHYLEEASKAALQEVLGKMHHEAVDRTQLVLLKKRARGHAAAAKFSKNIQKANTRLTTLLKHHNAITGIIQQTIENAREPDSELYTELPSVNHVPFPVLRDAIRLSNTIERAQEEIAAVSVELPAVVHGYEKLNDSLEQAIVQISPPSSKLQEGVIAAVIRKIIYNETCKEALTAEILKSLRIHVQIESIYCNSFPSQYIPSESVEEEEEEEEEGNEHEEGQDQDDDYHASDDECASEDEM